MEKLRVAVATADGVNFVVCHFGEALFYDVYDISRDGAEFLRRVTNETEDEAGHAAAGKATGVAALLQAQGVQVAMTRVFGPNIKRIRKRFVCVLTGHEGVTEGLFLIQQFFPDIVREWQRGEVRDFLDLR